MTPLAIRHTLSAFATAALVFAAASGAVAGQAGKGTGVKDYSGASKSISDPGRIKSLSLSDEQ